MVLVVALVVLEHPLELLVVELLPKQNYLLTPLFLIPLLLVLVVMVLMVQRKLAIQMVAILLFQPLHQRVVEQVVLTGQLAQLVTANAAPGRSDITAVFAAAVIAEHLMAFELTNALLEKFGGDSLKEIQTRVNAWRKHTKKLLRG